MKKTMSDSPAQDTAAHAAEVKTGSHVTKRLSVSDSVASIDSSSEELTNTEAKKKKSKRPYQPKPALQERWEEMFIRLLQYKEQHGHCLVPNRYSEDPSLGAWVSTQRRQYKVLTSGSSESTPMTPDRAARLMSIGFVWATKDPRHVPWETRYRELCEFQQKYGHCLVPIGFKDNVQLSNWVSTQRQERKMMREGRTSSRMTPDRVRLLDAIGFVWEAQRGGLRRKGSASRSNSATQHILEPERATAAVENLHRPSSNVARLPSPPERLPESRSRTTRRRPPPSDALRAAGLAITDNGVDPITAAGQNQLAAALGGDEAVVMRGLSARDQEALLRGAADPNNMMIRPVVVPVPVPVAPGATGLMPPAFGFAGLGGNNMGLAGALGGNNMGLAGALGGNNLGLGGNDSTGLAGNNALLQQQLLQQALLGAAAGNPVSLGPLLRTNANPLLGTHSNPQSDLFRGGGGFAALGPRHRSSSHSLDSDIASRDGFKRRRIGIDNDAMRRTSATNRRHHESAPRGGLAVDSEVSTSLIRKVAAELGERLQNGRSNKDQPRHPYRPDSKSVDRAPLKDNVKTNQEQETATKFQDNDEVVFVGASQEETKMAASLKSDNAQPQDKAVQVEELKMAASTENDSEQELQDENKATDTNQQEQLMSITHEENAKNAVLPKAANTDQTAVETQPQSENKVLSDEEPEESKLSASDDKTEKDKNMASAPTNANQAQPNERNGKKAKVKEAALATTTSAQPKAANKVLPNQVVPTYATRADQQDKSGTRHLGDSTDVIDLTRPNDNSATQNVERVNSPLGDIYDDADEDVL